jgi:hypothetical protein
VTRAEKRRQEHEEKIAKLRERGVKHYKTHLGEKPPAFPRLPRTQREVQMHLSGRHTDLFRDPVNRQERREWDKFWKLKGPGFTKPDRSGERYSRG